MEKTGGSRLLQMQARFQQKQMQEKELKIASLYVAQQARALDRVRQSPSNGTVSTPSPPISNPPGKVRQMFEERRTKAGIDKSYPLQPIQNTEKAQPRKAIPNGYSKVSNTTSKVAVEKKSSLRTFGTTSSHSVKKQISQVHKTNNNIINGSGDLNHNHEIDLNNHKEPSTNGEKASKDELDYVKHNLDRLDNELLENETFPEALAPVASPRTPDYSNKLVKRSPGQQSLKAGKVTPKPSAIPPKKTTSENVVSESSKPRGVMQRGVNPVPRRNPVSPQVSGGTKKPRAGVTSASRSGAGASAGVDSGSADTCTVCGRHFAPDRLAKHQDICRKTHTKKRKPFDVLKHRLAVIMFFTT
ncbi:unnamed protein product [Leptosia nina]|uniref:C2HC/C3H-type domain-containing protein n=1 Tax=Leptosia nina TaxID=320188 RepID=A0AAV1JJP4_9NEOP